MWQGVGLQRRWGDLHYYCTEKSIFIKVFKSRVGKRSPGIILMTVGLVSKQGNRPSGFSGISYATSL